MSILEEEMDEIVRGNNPLTEHGETLKHLSDDENYTKKTVFDSNEQAYAYATLMSIANENDVTFLKDWLKQLTDCFISVEGQGRKDIVEVSRYKSGGGLPFGEKLLEKFDKK